MSLAEEKQSFANRIIEAHLRKNRLASTYLITGGEEAGKEKFALLFACALNCEKGKIFEGCSCNSCHKVITFQHPDVQWTGRDIDVKSIKIEQVREIRNQAALRPYEGKWKVFIFVNAERLTAEAQNALLKTLEEPPDHSIFCLLVGNKAHLFETIRSRAFEVRLPSDEGAFSSSVSVFGELSENTHWPEFLDGHQTTPREKLKPLMESLLSHFHQRLKSCSNQPASAARCVEAIDRICETKEALEDNVNQKLALTRLAIWLHRLDRRN